MLTRLAGLLVAAVVLAGCASAPAGPSGGTLPSPTGTPHGAPFDVAAQHLGMHSYSTKPQTGSGAFRMPCFPLWREVEPRRGQYDWSLFDEHLRTVESFGGASVLYAFCGTPRWAGETVADPDVEVFGPGSTAAPRRLSDFEDFVRAVVRRYRGRIDAYEVWNEASSPQFFQGTPQQMARMTQAVLRVVRAEDPDALVTTASVQTHRRDYWRGFAVPYLRQLKALDWPVEVFNGHFYPAGTGGPAERRRQIALMQDELRELRAPALPLWDTEVNYYTDVPGDDPDGRVVGRQAAAWATRTYLDSWRLGLSHTYWYLWATSFAQFPGIQTRPGMPATTALATLSAWVTGARFDGCQDDDRLVRCRFRGADGAPFEIAWTESRDGAVEPATSYPGSGSLQVCQVTDGSCTTATDIRVDGVPVRISAPAPA